MFGYFSRRCHLAFMKLSYEGKYKLFEDYQAWINGQLISGAVYMRNDILSRGKHRMVPLYRSALNTPYL